MNSRPADEWLSLVQISDELHVPLRTLYNRRGRGDFARGYRIGKHVRVRRSDYEVWLEAQADPDPAA